MKVAGTSNKYTSGSYYGKCDICEVVYGTETVSIQHMISIKHHKRYEAAQRSLGNPISHFCPLCGIGGMNDLNEWNNHVASALHSGNYSHFMQISNAQKMALKRRFLDRQTRQADSKAPSEKAKATSLQTSNAQPEVKRFNQLPSSCPGTQNISGNSAPPKILRLDSFPLPDSSCPNTECTLQPECHSKEIRSPVCAARHHKTHTSRSGSLPKDHQRNYHSSSSRHVRQECYPQRPFVQRQGDASAHSWTGTSTQYRSPHDTCHYDYNKGRRSDRFRGEGFRCESFRGPSEFPKDKDNSQSAGQRSRSSSRNVRPPSANDCHTLQPAPSIGNSPKSAFVPVAPERVQEGGATQFQTITRRSPQQEPQSSQQQSPTVPLSAAAAAPPFPPASNSATFAKMHEVWEISEALDKLRNEQATISLYIRQLKQIRQEVSFSTSLEFSTVQCTLLTVITILGIECQVSMSNATGISSVTNNLSRST
uniref:C2H2-type domain-containing protein n=1 Tax=Mesocestoides corti TaxID=53468 RepID=A0A5K3EFQ1_MESCO